LLVRASTIISGGSPPDLTNSGITARTYSKSFIISALVIMRTSKSVRVKYSGKAVKTLWYLSPNTILPVRPFFQTIFA